MIWWAVGKSVPSLVFFFFSLQWQVGRIWRRFLSTSSLSNPLEGFCSQGRCTAWYGKESLLVP